MNNNCKSVLSNTATASEFILQLVGKTSNAISDLFNVTLSALKKRGVQDKITRQRTSRTEQNNSTIQVLIFFSWWEMAYSWGKSSQLCLQAQTFDFCCRQAGALRHGEREASGRATPHVASHSLTSGLDSNGLFPLLRPNPHCLSAVLININQM